MTAREWYDCAALMMPPDVDRRPVQYPAKVAPTPPPVGGIAREPGLPDGARETGASSATGEALRTAAVAAGALAGAVLAGAALCARRRVK
jgi:hypothetical protein